ncbi:putative nicotinamidase/pyrazinamidase [Magnetospirillum gryphiswaldense MSR-1 v2]|uniref:Nicotinamidase/pyrazinamidase n=1 Tax=Magnetospirillum gryphiswaldense (strain DSM 6361 / JCM 21280 / NBRC 15271 / MSR-1) TaxID=431944 RepID=V6EYM1_MAGGM|nr:nicotinamidase/pyrazinamidase [Magnetospirillum gryphiswaldense]CDK98350.1 putative nicotinamidase/pyrazinamidase [Magnetospirillum gryphiswaldense MSR-1 v2]
MSDRIRLLIIDPQMDFCDGPANGALPVPGAYADMTRLATLIDRLGGRIGAIDVTMDSHHALDIAHPTWWQNDIGENPPPFTIISAQDVAAGRWRPRNSAWGQRSLDYVRKLEGNGKYALVIWPPHCLIGSSGHAVQPELFGALRRWEERALSPVNFVVKGANPFTEHYSAVAAEVPDPADPATSLNSDLLERLTDCDVLLLAGEALSHCVKATVSDIADNIDQAHIHKFVLLTDCTSPVPAIPGGPDFPAAGQAFITHMRARGMRVCASSEFN